jgi:hypothetical protein|tara:strand:- start:176 stop:403 length:228 start_codon:yes stop_codon:yes gene_type:complete
MRCGFTFTTAVVGKQPRIVFDTGPSGAHAPFAAAEERSNAVQSASQQQSASHANAVTSHVQRQSNVAAHDLRVGE